MSRRNVGDMARAGTDDRVLWDIIAGYNGCRVLLLAHELKLFPLLAERPRTLAEICDVLKIARRPAEALLTVCISLGLVQRAEERYGLTSVSEEYLVPSSPTFFGGRLDMMIANENQPVGFLDPLKEAVRTNASQIYAGAGLFTVHAQDAARAGTFTRAMHGVSMGPALVWPDTLDLAGHRIMLDIGGGSGAHAIGATQRWPSLHAIVLDLAPVCEVADEYIAHYGLQQRIGTMVVDLWQDPFPPADVHFYSNIYHDWPPEKCQFLTRKSFESLQPGGRLIIHEMLYNDEKTGPFAVASVAIAMLLSTEGQQFVGRELAAMLVEAGFVDIEVRPTFGYWSIITGRKA
jgi:O-methyltransferase/methyltransferase family protein